MTLGPYSILKIIMVILYNIIYPVLSQRAEGYKKKEMYFRIEIEAGIVVVDLTISEPIFRRRQ